MQKKSTMIDGFLMASVRIVIIVFSMLITMILSRTLPLADYGTYSTGNLIINTATSLSALGLLDAVNYYYNGVSCNRDKYINTVFLCIVVLGFLAASVIMLFQNLLTAYFHNPKLATIYAYIALRPFLDNLALGFNKLQLSIGNARFVAIRNFLISLGKLVIVFFVSTTTKNIDTIFQCILFLEIFTVALNFILLEKNSVHIRIQKSDLRLLPDILKFCLPMGIYIQASAIAKSLDIFVIGRFEPTEQLAIYANCSAHLPIDFIPIAFLTVLIPRITRYVQNHNISGGTRLIQNFVKVAYMTTWAFGTACIVLTPQAINFLYGNKYLDGSVIFILYAIADMLCLSHISIFLSAKGHTKTLMWISLGTLGVNLVANFLAYLLVGFIGPAVVTVLVMTGSTAILLQKSAAIFNCKFLQLYDWGHLLKFLASCILFGGCTLALRLYLEQLNWHPTIILILCGALCCLSILGANYKALRLAFIRLNQNDESN